MSDTLITQIAARKSAPAASAYSALSRAIGVTSRVRAAVNRRGAEPYDALLWRLQSRRQDSDLGAAMLGLVGCEPRTGASTIAANLAVCASEVGLGPVLLVEADVERPRIRKHWRLPSGPGLAELALGIASCSECIYDGPAPGLHVVPAAEGPSRCVVGWDAAVVDAFLAEVAADHNLVLFDLPAAERMNHSLLLARRLDQVLLVVRAERTRGPHAKRVAERLREDGVPLGGVVLNRQRRYVPRWLSRWI